MFASKARQERLAWAAALVLVGIGGVLAGRHSASTAVPGPALTPAPTHAPTHAKAPLQTPYACRPGAFLEADRILGATVSLARALPPSTPAPARAELDSILFTALQQARTEVHCVSGVLTHGYDKAYANTVRGAMALAEQRQLSPDVIAIAQDVVRALEINRPIAR